MIVYYDLYQQLQSTILYHNLSFKIINQQEAKATQIICCLEPKLIIRCFGPLRPTHELRNAHDQIKASAKSTPRANFLSSSY